MHVYSFLGIFHFFVVVYDTYVYMYSNAQANAGG
jgi:hypothetical protein